MNDACVRRMVLTACGMLGMSAGETRGDIHASLDLDRDGTVDMELSESVTDVGGRRHIERHAAEGLRNALFDASWGDPAIKWMPVGTDASLGSEFVITQTTGLEVKEKRSAFRWRSGAGEWKEQRLSTHGVVISNEVSMTGSIFADFGGDSGLGGAVSLTFSSEIKDGSIVHTLSNAGRAAITVKWQAAGFDLTIPAGEKRTMSVRSARGAVERLGTATFNWDPYGVGALPIELPLLHYARPPRVPAPGTLALAGLAGIGATRRRR